MNLMVLATSFEPVGAAFDDRRCRKGLFDKSSKGRNGSVKSLTRLEHSIFSDYG